MENHQCSETEELIHLPDLLFVRYCETAGSINRGVYNTIDHYFYQCGRTSIMERRRMIILFLDDLTEKHSIRSKGKINFGKQGLISRLETFNQIFTQELSGCRVIQSKEVSDHASS
ncbi:hypothetical protein [Salibacterium aidingense]|uniref:hypothetical protein n=1 Tax=Salibacterium aidingense TaxID=384933 RepID=UPI0004120189|nr:hypothetical protein [Salibacterium aidingense]